MWWVRWIKGAGQDRNTPVDPLGSKTHHQNFPWTQKLQDLILKRQPNSGLDRFPQILSSRIFKSVWRRNILASGYPFVWLSTCYFICNTLTFIMVGEQWSARCLPVCFSEARLLARMTSFIYLVNVECLIYPSCSTECLRTTWGLVLFSPNIGCVGLERDLCE